MRRDPGDDRGAAAADADTSRSNLRSIVDRVRPSVEVLLQTELRHDPDALVHHAVRANVRASVNHLRHGSELLEQLIQDGGLLVVGAEYSLETGVVEFFDSAARLARTAVRRPGGQPTTTSLICTSGDRSVYFGTSAMIVVTCGPNPAWKSATTVAEDVAHRDIGRLAAGRSAGETFINRVRPALARP